MLNANVNTVGPLATRRKKNEKVTHRKSDSSPSRILCRGPLQVEEAEERCCDWRVFILSRWYSVCLPSRVGQPHFPVVSSNKKDEKRVKRREGGKEREERRE